MNMLDTLMTDFIRHMTNGNIELYNEAGLQHELGYFLRCNNVQVKFEYNINKIFDDDNEFLKTELDLYVVTNNEQYCVELKFPDNGAYPRRMTQSIIDIFFLQQLVNNGFKKGYFLFITRLAGFKDGDASEGVYSYFRRSRPLNEFCCQDIPRFMLNEEAKALNSLIDSGRIDLKSDYKIEFKSFGLYYYFLLSIAS